MKDTPHEILQIINWTSDPINQSVTAHFDLCIHKPEESAPLFAPAITRSELDSARGIAEMFLAWLEDKGFSRIGIKYEQDGRPIIVFSGSKLTDLMAIPELKKSIEIALRATHIATATTSDHTPHAARRIRARIEEGEATPAEQWRFENATKPKPPSSPKRS